MCMDFSDQFFRRFREQLARDFADAPPDDALLDDEFPLGDGTADTESLIRCPYCGQMNDIALDPGSGESQDYVEDCQICCRPWRVLVEYRADGSAAVSVEAADELD